MRIFYAVQATGNGHISRAMEILPALSQYGEVDVFLSGSNATLKADLPVVMRSKGISLHYTSKGKINFLKTALNIDPLHVLKYAKELPLKQYDLIINDFESITSLACKWQRVPSVHFGHQASFASPRTPRPRHKNFMGEAILKYYASGTVSVGLHFAAYDQYILPPVIKTEIWNAQPTKQDFICVYLPSCSDEMLLPYLSQIKDCSFHVFSRQTSYITTKQNCTFFPVDKALFNLNLTHCQGIITSAGFETPAEAMALNKKILAIPIGGQYEQQCNAAALAKLGVFTLSKIDLHFTEKVRQWLDLPDTVYDHSFNRSTADIIQEMMQIAEKEQVFTSQSHQLLFE
jgi:uncharacterized protein (TIGR00661 family)